MIKRFIYIALLFTFSQAQQYKITHMEGTYDLDGDGFMEFVSVESKTNENNKYSVVRYYELDDNGLLFKSKDFFKKGFRSGDNLNLQIMSRTYLASSNDNRKKFQFKLIIKKKGKILLDRNLTYNKKISSAASPEHKKGFSLWPESILKLLNVKYIIMPYDNFNYPGFKKVLSADRFYFGPMEEYDGRKIQSFIYKIE